MLQFFYGLWRPFWIFTKKLCSAPGKLWDFDRSFSIVHLNVSWNFQLYIIFFPSLPLMVRQSKILHFKFDFFFINICAHNNIIYDMMWKRHWLIKARSHLVTLHNLCTKSPKLKVVVLHSLIKWVQFWRLRFNLFHSFKKVGRSSKSKTLK